MLGSLRHLVSSPSILMPPTLRQNVWCILCSAKGSVTRGHIMCSCSLCMQGCARALCAQVWVKMLEPQAEAARHASVGLPAILYPMPRSVSVPLLFRVPGCCHMRTHVFPSLFIHVCDVPHLPSPYPVAATSACAVASRMIPFFGHVCTACVDRVSSPFLASLVTYTAVPLFDALSLALAFPACRTEGE